MVLENNILKQAGDFKVLKTLAKSSFSNVYLVEHLKTQKQYALKAIKNPNNKFRIENEISIMRTLNPLEEVLSLHNVFYDEKKLFFVYELARDNTLKHFIDNQAILDDEKILAIFSSLLQTLKKIHNSGIVHHDIKPDNIIIDDNKYFFCDFGLSIKNQKNVRLVHLKTDTLFGAPEIYSGICNQRSDIYALGATLYYMSTKMHAYDLTREDSDAYSMLAHCKLNVDFTKIKSKKIQYLVKRMMDKNFSQRASIPELEYILLNDYSDLELQQAPVDYSIEKQRTDEEIYQELALDNIAFAQNALATIFSTNNVNMAFEYYEKAVENNLVKAYFNLGLCYKDGIGCTKDLKKSFEYFSKAAIHNHESSIFMTALFYEYGVHVKKNLYKSKQLYLTSAYYGYKKAYEKLNNELFLSKSKKKLNYNSSS